MIKVFCFSCVKRKLRAEIIQETRKLISSLPEAHSVHRDASIVKPGVVDVGEGAEPPVLGRAEVEVLMWPSGKHTREHI